LDVLEDIAITYHNIYFGQSASNIERTIMQAIQMIQHQSLRFDEIERIAYISGMPLANYFLEMDDQEIQIDGFDDQLKKAADEAYARGKHDGMGADTADQIESLEHRVEALQGSCTKAKSQLLAIYQWLGSDDCKTLKGRKAFQEKVRVSWMNTDTY